MLRRIKPYCDHGLQHTYFQVFSQTLLSDTCDLCPPVQVKCHITHTYKGHEKSNGYTY